MANVGNTTCPECGRTWTGEFLDDPPKQAVCKDCIAKHGLNKKGHPDIHINPSGE